MPRIYNYFIEEKVNYFRAIGQLQQLKVAIRNCPEPTSNVKAIQKELSIWEEFIKAIGAILPPMITSDPQSLIPDFFLVIKFEQLISYLFQENKIYQGKIDDKNFMFIPVTKNVCFCIPNVAGSLDLFKNDQIEVIQTLPGDIQIEFDRGAVDLYPKIQEKMKVSNENNSSGLEPILENPLLRYLLSLAKSDSKIQDILLRIMPNQTATIALFKGDYETALQGLEPDQRASLSQAVAKFNQK